MGIFKWIKNRNETLQRERNRSYFNNIRNESFKNSLTKMSDAEHYIRQFENYVWYKGDSDELMYIYGLGAGLEGAVEKKLGGYRRNYQNYFWHISNDEEGVKRTHSGLPKVYIDTPIKCLGAPNIEVLNNDKTEDIERTKLLKEIIKENGFLSTFKKQITMDCVVGDGAYFINVNKKVSDYPIIEYFDGRDVTYEFIGDEPKSVIISRHYAKGMKEYECFEKRSTTRIKQEDNTYKRVATVEYSLYEVSSEKGYNEVPLNTIEETKDLENLQFNNIPFILAVPTIREKDVETKRGVSAFQGKIELFDDFDQNISQEANIMRRISPVEYVDVTALDKDDKGQPIKPKSFGKQFVLYKGAENYDQTNEAIKTVFYDVDFTKITSASLETLNRCLSGWVSPATLGLELARNSTDLSQREKEKVTLQTVKHLKEYSTDVLTTLFKRVLAVYDLMLNENATLDNEAVVQVRFKDYANPTLDSKLQSFLPALIQGGMSVERYVNELYGEASKEEKENEIKYITNYLKNLQDDIELDLPNE